MRIILGMLWIWGAVLMGYLAFYGLGCLKDLTMGDLGQVRMREKEAQEWIRQGKSGLPSRW
jgi:hypothetical protein